MTKSTSFLMIVCMTLPSSFLASADQKWHGSLFHRRLGMKGHAPDALSCPCFGPDIDVDTIGKCAQAKDGSILIVDPKEVSKTNYCVSKEGSNCGGMNFTCRAFDLRLQADLDRLDVCIEHLEKAMSDAGKGCGIVIG